MAHADKHAASSPAWQRSAGKNPEGGLNAKGRASYNHSTGGNLKAPVTESNPKGDRAKRQNSFCARMCGMKRVNTGGKTKKDPDSRINKSLRKWNCKCGSEQLKQAMMLPGLLGAFSGAAGGALTGKKHKVNRAIGRGALIGAATELGMYPGIALGAIPGTLIGNALAGPGGALPGAVIGAGIGAGTGGILGHSAAKGLLGAYETPEELEQEHEEKKMAAFEFGRKIATVTMCKAPEHNDQSGVDVNPVAAGTPEGKEKLTKKKAPVKAEDVVGKKANSLVNFVERKPKDEHKIPNGGNLNPVSAGEEHENVPEETEAHEFGRKLAQITADQHAMHQQDLNDWAGPREHRGLTPLGNAVFDSAGPAVKLVGGALGIPGANFAGLGLDALNLSSHVTSIQEEMLRNNKIRDYVEGYNKDNPTQPLKLPPTIRPRVVRPPKPPVTPSSDTSNTAGSSNSSGASTSTPPAPTPDAAAQTGGWGNLPLYAASGLSAAGLAALVYYMSQQKKKKKQEDDGLMV